MQIKKIFDRFFGSRHDRAARAMQPQVDQINAVWAQLRELPEEEFLRQTEKLRDTVKAAIQPLEESLEDLRRQRRGTEDADERSSLTSRIQNLEDELKGEIERVLEEILPEAFATVKEACRRLLDKEIVVTGQKMVWDMVPYDVQLIGAIALHQGKATEMATGEGKTLAATMPLYLNALAGRGAHLVTVNSYLSQRDSEWMGTIYKYLGMSVGCIDLHEPGSEARREAYQADITYGTNNEFGFDYLRDNMVHALDQRVQRAHSYAIIDEVDSILIDEARTPLIISGPVAQEQSDIYRRYNPSVAMLARKQNRLVSELIGEAQRDLEAGNREEAGEKLLAARRGLPAHKKLLKLFADDPGTQQLTQQTEMMFRKLKQLHTLDEMLLFAMDEKGHSVHLSDKGLDELSPDDPEAFVVPDISVTIGEVEEDPSLTPEETAEEIQRIEAEYAEKSQKIHAIHQLLKAYALFHRDEKYIVDDGQIVIVDEFTGRKMPGRRWSDGLHQAVEAKEGVTVKGETQTLATVTIQNYFRMYDKLAGMTGTAETEEGEFHAIYGLDVMVIPTNEPVIRDDRQDLVYRTVREKYNAIMDEIELFNRLELPVLVGTVSVEVSETLSRMLKRRGIPHSVLNAKFHQQEAEIVAHAGQPGAVTIATNMAGRGTDIKLGPGVTDMRTAGWCRERDIDLKQLAGSDPVRGTDYENMPEDEIIEVGGLHTIGSSRHESRRIDRQLRGRAGRQGDPGASQFFLSLEDDLMRMFGSERIAGIMERLGADEGEVISHALVTRSIERAQRRVEMQNFEARKRLLDFDDVMNQQREVIYDLRLFALEGGEDLKAEVWDMIRHAVLATVADFVREDELPEEWNLADLRGRLMLDYIVVAGDLPAENTPDHPFDTVAAVEDVALESAREAYQRKLDMFGDVQERVLSFLALTQIDEKWKDHLWELDQLKSSIFFRGWGQKDPLIEYKKEAYGMFVDLMADIRHSVATNLFRMQVAMPQVRRPGLPRRMVLTGPGDTAGSAGPSREPAMAAAGAAGQGGDAGLRPTQHTGISPSARTDMSRLQTNRGEAEQQRAPVRASAEDKVGRNAPCPCGSGKKHKKCCGVK